jgi:GalNAc-alpha-(1->4)-GalNAc-alpha-(1->3)-diNAcBac-PP-undecaprenol alpha-1,4-N-acetyl-D-galactosaminyltransferase
MRLTFVVHVIEPESGAERILSNMANYWVKKGWEVTIVNFRNEKGPTFYHFDPRITHRPIQFFNDSSNDSSSFFQRLKEVINRHLTLRRVIKESKPDCLIAFDPYQNSRTIVSIFGLRIPLIILENTGPTALKGKRWALMRRWLYPFASSLVVLTPQALAYYHKAVRKIACIIPCVIKFPEQDQITANQDDLTNKGKLLLAMGRLHKQKGFDLLLMAFQNVAHKYPDWNLVIWGEGELRSSLEEQRDQLGLHDRVQLPGVTEQPFKEMKKADLFVLSSRYEGFGLVIAEAMACGLPALSFDCPDGPSSIIRDGVDGVLVPHEDVPALSREMERLMGDELERKRLAERTLEIKERFSVEKIMGLWEELVYKLTGKNHQSKDLKV